MTRHAPNQRFASQYGPWAIVAGASEGLGAAFAASLANRGVSLLLLARRAQQLEAVALQLRATSNIEVRTMICDMARPDLATALTQATTNLDIGLIVYNAAFAPIGNVLDREAEELEQIVDVNIRGPLILSRLFAPQMVKRGKGGIVLMSSLAGFQGAPRIATYAASKAFNIVFGEGLWRELRSSGVDVLVSSAGAIRTPGYAKSAGKDAPGTLDAHEVAEATLRALGKGPLIVPGTVNRIARFVLGRLLPRRTAIEIFAKSTKDLS